MYWILTIPMMLIYIAIAVSLWTVNIAFFITYLAFFVLVAVLQGYVCVHWQCPYVGKFAPCVGGFCLPASRIALLFRNVRRSERTYNIVVAFAFLVFLAIIFFPLYFLFKLSLITMLVYIGIVLLYAVSFLLFICPVCATRFVCPGGQTAIKLKEMIENRSG